MEKIRISAVSYLNSLPFVYGLNHSEIKQQCEISLDIPSLCAEKMTSGKADIGLIPVAAIPEIINAEIISEYCIGANGKVKTVCLYSEVPLKKIETVLLDYQSRTSVLLARILAREFWKINPKWEKAEKGFENKIKGTTAGVVIGDRTFSLSLGKSRGEVLDLSEEWKKFTGLPFVFACWVANKKMSADFLTSFNSALQYGLNNIDKTLDEFPPDFIPKTGAKKYLTENISFVFDLEKKKAMKLFFELSKRLI